MTERSKKDFDFDDWAGLYKENPQEFEARRQAALMIELARGTPDQAASGKALLDSFEKRVKNADPSTRVRAASEMMLESLQQLNAEMMVLRESLVHTGSESQSD